VLLGRVLSRRAVDSLVAVVLAPVCAACRRPLDEPTRGAVCASCWSAVVPTTPLGCISFPPLISLATAIGPYEGALKDVIHALKYDARPTLAPHLARRMRDAGGAVLEGAGAVVPVPLHRARERTRGFNQARALAQGLGLPVIDALERTRKTEAQADLPAAKRQANVRGAFALSAVAESLDGLIVVLVDDVSTTGATLNACAAVLVEGGVREVRALTAARAPLKAAGRPR
jgi:ComF family protein